MNKKSFLSVRALTVTAMFTAVSYVLYLFGFKLPIVPSFLTMDFSELPAVIAALSMGPVAGAGQRLVGELDHLNELSIGGILGQVDRRAHAQRKYDQ